MYAQPLRAYGTWYRYDSFWIMDSGWLSQKSLNEPASLFHMTATLVRAKMTPRLLVIYVHAARRGWARPSKAKRWEFRIQYQSVHNLQILSSAGSLYADNLPLILESLALLARAYTWYSVS